MDGTSTWVKPERETQQLLAGENFDNTCHRVSGSLSRQLRVVYAAKYQWLLSKQTIPALQKKLEGRIVRREDHVKRPTSVLGSIECLQCVQMLFIGATRGIHVLHVEFNRVRLV